MGGATLRIGRNELLAEAGALRFRPEMLEKVLQLIHLLNAICRHPYLADRVALKGGTALNLFLFDLPRLSVDIDLNYVGSVGREDMEQEKPLVYQSIQALAAREGYSITRVPTDHAGGKFRLRYESELIAAGNLELDINFILRVPLWPIELHDSIAVAGLRAERIPVLNEHELAAGKFAALFARTAVRDLYDTHRLLTTRELDPERLRLAFVVYGGLNRKDWRTVSAANVTFQESEAQDQLLPLLRSDSNGSPQPNDAHTWGQQLASECRARLSIVLPFRKREREFLDKLLDSGEIAAELLN